MFVVSGILSAKTLIKKGISEFGAWKITNFLIKKNRKGKKILIPLVARGYWANYIDEMPIGEKLICEFYIEGKKHKEHYFPNCVIVKIEKKEKKEKKKKIKDELNFKKTKNMFQEVKDTNLFNQEKDKR